jgi:hypothetical protein
MRSSKSSNVSIQTEKPGFSTIGKGVRQRKRKRRLFFDHSRKNTINLRRKECTVEN